MNYVLKRGVITESRSIDSDNTPLNLFHVRIVPDMAEIFETNLLPYYPNFFADCDVAYQPDDQVWVVCSPDFHVGFIVGLAQHPAGSSITSLIQLITTAEVAGGYQKSGYNELTIMRVAGQALHFSNVVTGNAGAAYSNGTVFIYGADGSIWVQTPYMKMNVSNLGDITVTGESLTEQINGNIDVVSDVSSESANKKRIDTTGSFTLNSSGSYTRVAGTNASESSILDTEVIIGGKKTETIGTGDIKNVALGGTTHNITAGGYALNVVAGVISLTTLAGTISMQSTGGISLISSNVTVTAPLVTFPMGLVAPTGLGPFCSLPFCLMTGAPHVGNVLAGV